MCPIRPFSSGETSLVVGSKTAPRRWRNPSTIAGRRAMMRTPLGTKPKTRSYLSAISSMPGTSSSGNGSRRDMSSPLVVAIGSRGCRNNPGANDPPSIIDYRGSWKTGRGLAGRSYREMLSPLADSRGRIRVPPLREGTKDEEERQRGCPLPLLGCRCCRRSIYRLPLTSW